MIADEESDGRSVVMFSNIQRTGLENRQQQLKAPPPQLGYRDPKASLRDLVAMIG